MKKTIEYIAKNKERFMQELFELLRIPSISAESEHKPDMLRCAEYIADNLIKSGADKTEVIETKGAPIVYAEKMIDPALPTVLVYGHYDVMPVQPIELWRTDPFEPQIIDGRIYARGANDDKGQGFMHFKVFEAMNQTGELPCNVKFMIEGEEEIGSDNLAIWCKDNVERLKADIILISDTGMISMDVPSITCGLRGLCYMEVTVKGPSQDLHSGLFGGAVANPINVLTRMITKLTDDKGKITIPNFYDDVKIYSIEERAAINKAPFSEEKYRESLNVDATMGEEGYTTLERTGIRPALDVNGIWGGHTTEGAKTVIASEAHAKISMRLVPDQDYIKVGDMFEEYFRSLAPEGVKIEIKRCHGGYPYVYPTNTSAYSAAEKAIVDTFGKMPVPYYSGGSIPIVSTFEKVLGTKSLLLGFGLEEDAIHSPNESYRVANFEKGMDTIIQFYKHFTS